jgi:NAD/NADP transhydrogenase beta subunit
MYVNVAVLKETQPHERRVALTPSVAPKLIKLGAIMHMQTGAADSIKLGDATFPDVVLIPDCSELVANADVALVIGANDVVKPAARIDKSTPIFRMPILNADRAKQVYVVKRDQGKGNAGVLNTLFPR